MSDVIENATHLGQQGPPSFAERRAVGAAVEQFGPDLLLQLLDRIGDRRLRPVELAGRRREAASLHDGDEDLELVKGERIHLHQFR
jgi:hypothetical protein